MGSRNLCDPICLPFHVIIWVYKKLQEQNIQESLKMLTVIFSKLSIEKTRRPKGGCPWFHVCIFLFAARICSQDLWASTQNRSLEHYQSAPQPCSHRVTRGIYPIYPTPICRNLSAIRAFRPPCWASLPWPAPDVTDTHHRRWSTQQAEDEILMFKV